MSSSPTEPPRPPGDLPAHSEGEPPLPLLAPNAATRPTEQQIGPYHILEPIGEGGMGTVFKAEQREPIKRTVALKLIKLGMDSRQVIARFESERQALALMSHPNVAKVLDAGTSASGRPYFVMEFVPGEPITTFCDRHHYTTRQRLELFQQACAAVQHAHQKAIIHRDLKPSNILVMLQDGVPTVKVIDFGVAKAIAQKLTEQTLFTETGQLVGTREYMSPEQADPDAFDIDTRTDVYSLGVVLYELLAGALPFDSKSLRSAGYAEMQRIIREVDPPRPSTRLSRLGPGGAVVAENRQVRLDQLEKELQSELEWIPLTAMRKDRARRYSTPIELAHDIDNYLNQLPLAAAPESATYRLRKFVRRNRGPVTAAAVVLIVLVAGVIGTTIGLVGQSRQRKIAVRERLGAQSQAQRADREAQRALDEAAKQQAINGFLNEMLSAADPNKLLGDKVTVLQATTQAIRRLDEGTLADQPLIEASVRDSIGETLVALSRLAEAEPVFRRSLELKEKHLSPDDPNLATAFNNLGGVLQELGRYGEAQTAARRALEIRRRVLPPQHPDLGQSYNNLASLTRVLGNPAEAEALFRQALAIRRAQQPPNEMEIARTLNNLAGPLQDLRKLDEAEAVQRESLEIRRRILPPAHSDIAQALHNVASIVAAQHRYAEAESLYRESLRIVRQTLPAGHLEIAWSLNGLGQALRAQGKLDEAATVLTEALAIRRDALTPPHPNIAASMYNLAWVRANQQDAAGADQLFREAIDMYRRARPNGHRDTALALAGMARWLRERGDAAGAEPLLREALDVATRVLPAGNRQISQIASDLAALLSDRGNLEEAATLRQRYPLPATAPATARTNPPTESPATSPTTQRTP